MSRPPSEFTRQSVAVASAVTVAVALSGSQLASTSISVFIARIGADYGWSITQISGAVSMLYLGMGLSAPVLGVLTDRFGPRAILLPLTLLSGLLITAFSATGGALLLFYAVHLLLGLTQPGLLTYNKMISSWFSRSRGLALSAIGIGVVIAQIAGPPAARWLEAHYGWHHAYRVFGALELLVALPVLYAFFRERPAVTLPAQAAVHAQIQPEEPGQAQDDHGSKNVFSPLRSRLYWHLIAAQVCVLFGFLSVTTHGVGILVERGVGPDHAIWGLSTFAAGGFAAQLLSGVLLDRFDTPKIIAPFALLALFSLLLLQYAHGEVLALSAIFLFGFGCTACGPISYFTTRYFGVRRFSTVFGTIFPIMMALGAGSPVLFGAIFDLTHSYGAALVLVDVAMIAGCVLLATLPPYRYAVRSGALSLEVDAAHLAPAASRTKAQV